MIENLVDGHSIGEILEEHLNRNTRSSEHATAAKDFRIGLHELFAALAAGGGYRDAAELTVQLVLLYDGANVSAQLDHNPAAARAARDAAASLLNAARVR